MFFNFGILIVSFVVIYLLDSLWDFTLFGIFLLVCLVITKTNVFKYLKLLALGLFLSVVVVVSSLVSNFNVSDAFNLGLISFVRFLFYFCCSLIFKLRTSNGELAYIISCLFLGFGFWGYNQNKMYTLVLIILNNIHFMYFNVRRMWFFVNLNHPNLSKIKRVKMIISLISPFISNCLKQQHEVSVSLISKEYQSSKKRIRYYRRKVGA